VECKELKSNVSGSGNVEVAELRASSAEVEVNGSGNITYNGMKISKKLDASISGSGNIAINGKVDVVNVEIRGSGNLTGKIDCDNVTIRLYTVPLDNDTGYEYRIYSLPITLASDHTTVTAAYVKCTVEIVNEPAQGVYLVPVYQQSTNTKLTAKYIAVDRTINIDDEYISLEEFYDRGWIMMKYHKIVY
jgi:hypothetical protein